MNELKQQEIITLTQTSTSSPILEEGCSSPSQEPTRQSTIELHSLVERYSHLFSSLSSATIDALNSDKYWSSCSGKLAERMGFLEGADAIAWLRRKNKKKPFTSLLEKSFHTWWSNADRVVEVLTECFVLSGMQTKPLFTGLRCRLFLLYSNNRAEEYLKWKLTSVFSFIHSQPLPKKPDWALDDDLGHILSGGPVARFTLRIKRYATSDDIIKYEKSLSVAMSILYAKRAFPQMSDHQIQDEVDDWVDYITKDHTEEVDAKARSIDVSPREPVTVQELCRQVRRTALELFTKKNRPLSQNFCWPSEQSHMHCPRKKGGARPYLQNDWEKEMEEGLSRYCREDVPDTYYEMLVRLAHMEKNEVTPVGLAEPLKCRIISRGPRHRYAVGKYINKATHNVLRNHPCFRLTGEECSNEYLDERFPDLRCGEGFLSGDYKASTDRLHPLLTRAAVEGICDAWDFPPMLRDIYMDGLLNHTIANYVDPFGSAAPVLWTLDKDAQAHQFKCNRCGVLCDGLSEHWREKGHLADSCIFYEEVFDHTFQHDLVEYRAGGNPNSSGFWYVKDGREEPLKVLYRSVDKAQKWGQLMGSPMSFPILCIVNAAINRHFLELTYEKDLTLRQCPMMINGDDILMIIRRHDLKFWEHLVSTAGLTPSLGKNYFSDKFAMINSRVFLYEPPKPTFAVAQELLNEDYHEWFERRFGYHYVRCCLLDGDNAPDPSPSVLERRMLSGDRPSYWSEKTNGWFPRKFRKVPFVNLGLVWGCKRSVAAGSGSLDLEIGDVVSGYANLSARAFDLIEGHTDEMKDKLMTCFIRHHRSVLDELGAVPWFLPIELGGVGLPVTREDPTTDQQLMVGGLVAEGKVDFNLGGVFHPLKLRTTAWDRVRSFLKREETTTVRCSRGELIYRKTWLPREFEKWQPIEDGLDSLLWRAMRIEGEWESEIVREGMNDDYWDERHQQLVKRMQKNLRAFVRSWDELLSHVTKRGRGEEGKRLIRLCREEQVSRRVDQVLVSYDNPPDSKPVLWLDGCVGSFSIQETIAHGKCCDFNIDSLVQTFQWTDEQLHVAQLMSLESPGMGGKDR
jgi:hypothetical protein